MSKTSTDRWTNERLSDLRTLDERLDDLEAILARIGEAVVAPPARWLSVREAAKHSGLGERSIKSLLASGHLAAHRPVRGRVLIDRDELDALIRSSTAVRRVGRGRTPRER